MPAFESFLSDHGIPIGTPDAVPVLADRIAGPDSFRDELSSMLAPLCSLYETISYVDLFAVLLVAAAGEPGAEAASRTPALQDPLCGIFGFIVATQAATAASPPEAQAEETAANPCSAPEESLANTPPDAPAVAAAEAEAEAAPSPVAAAPLAAKPLEISANILSPEPVVSSQPLRTSPGRRPIHHSSCRARRCALVPRPRRRSASEPTPRHQRRASTAAAAKHPGTRRCPRAARHAGTPPRSRGLARKPRNRAARPGQRRFHLGADSPRGRALRPPRHPGPLPERGLCRRCPCHRPPSWPHVGQPLQRTRSQRHTRRFVFLRRAAPPTTPRHACRARLTQAAPIRRSTPPPIATAGYTRTSTKTTPATTPAAQQLRPALIAPATPAAPTPTPRAPPHNRDLLQTGPLPPLLSAHTQAPESA